MYICTQLKVNSGISLNYRHKVTAAASINCLNCWAILFESLFPDSVNNRVYIGNQSDQLTIQVFNKDYSSNQTCSLNIYWVIKF